MAKENNEDLKQRLDSIIKRNRVQKKILDKILKEIETKRDADN